MPAEFSLREHKNYAIYTPDYTFSKSDASVLRATSTDPALGDGYFFIVVNRAWLNGKYLRFSWRSVILETTISCTVRIYDGAYDRTSDVDFPTGAGLLAKGNGLLQTVVNRTNPFAWETIDVQANVAAGSETDCTIFFKIHDNQASLTGSMDLDWFEINSAAGGSGGLLEEQFEDTITMERTGTSGDYGYIGEDIQGINLGASFEVGKDSRDLPAKFVLRQDIEELAAGFFLINAGSADLTGALSARRSGLLNLPAAMNITHPSDLPAKFRVERVYDLRGTAGIAFYWWGAANPPEAMNQLILETPTGFWYTDFVDGPASLRYVFIPWGSFTWVSAAQRHLEPHRHGFNTPDRSQIDGILYTIHTTGVRRIDYIHAPSMAPFPAKFTVRHSNSLNLSAGFTVRHSETYNMPSEMIVRPSGSAELAAGFSIRQLNLNLFTKFNAVALNEELTGEFVVLNANAADLAGAFVVHNSDSRELAASFDAQVSLNLSAKLISRPFVSQNLAAGFLIRQDTVDLAAKFILRQDVRNLPAKMSIIGVETEDFEDATLVDHYQHHSGTGYRNAVFPHTGTYSWRTPQGSNDIFDISNGETLTYAKVTVWAIYGNGTRKIELLDSDLNVLDQTTWGFISGYHQKSVEYTGAVKYFRITCPAGGNSGLWTDDIEIKWAT